MKEFYKELLHREEYLKQQIDSPDSEELHAAIKLQEIQLIIIRVQQILLSEIKD